MAENTLVEELVTSLIKDKTIKPSERDSVSDILSKAMQNVPNDQIPTFKKRIEILAESSNQVIFTNLGVNLGALQQVVTTIVQETQIIQANENDSHSSLANELTNALDPEKENSVNSVIPEDSPEYVELDKQNRNYLKTFGDNDNIGNPYTAYKNPDLNLSPEAVEDLQQACEMQETEDSQGMIQVERLERVFNQYCSQGFPNDIAFEKACKDFSLTVEQVKNSKDYNRFVALNYDKKLKDKIAEVKEQTGKDITIKEIFENYPELAPTNNPFLNQILPPQQINEMKQNYSSYMKKLSNAILISIKQKELGFATKRLQNSEKKLSNFKAHGFADDYSAYTKLLINQFEAENNYFRVQNDIDTLVSGKITNPIIHNAALDYLTSNKSVSEIYYELQKKYPNEKIFFNDIMNEIKTTIDPVSDKEWSVIGQNEANIHKKQLELQALDLYPPTRNKEAFDLRYNSITQYISSQKNTVEQLKNHYRINYGLELSPQEKEKENLSYNEKKQRLIQKLYSKSIENQKLGDTPQASIKKACRDLNISLDDLSTGGNLHDSIADFFKDRIHATATNSDYLNELDVVKHSPMLNPEQNILMNYFFTDKEKQAFIESQKTYSIANLERLQKSQKEDLNNSTLKIYELLTAKTLSPNELLKESLRKVDLERKYSETTYSIKERKTPNAPPSPLVQKAVNEYFSSSQSISEIYTTMKQNPQTQDICFEDILREVSKIAKENIDNPTYINILAENEREIHRNNATIDAFKNCIKLIKKSNFPQQNLENELLTDIQSYFDINSKKTVEKDTIKNFIAKKIATPEQTYVQEEALEKNETPIEQKAFSKSLAENFSLDSDEIAQQLNSLKELSKQDLEHSDQNKVNQNIEPNSNHKTQNVGPEL